MKRHVTRNAVIAVAAATAFVLGGSTYALWSASADMGDTQVQMGDLELTAAKNNIQVWDISPDLINKQQIVVGGKTFGNGVKIDPASGAVVPRDELLLVVPFSMTLDGANLITRLDANYTDGTKPDSLSSVLTTTWTVIEANGQSVMSFPSTGAVSGTQAYFVTTEFSGLNTGDQATNSRSWWPNQALQSGVATNFFLVADMSFNDVDDATAAKAVLKLTGSVNLSLNQIRGAELANLPTL
ncbi:MAG: hypothetical protein FWF25_00480 [Propionibacteriaceae bacterium]|nr:hypothetical protein [Propionibacteriaceae bacterium]